MSNTPDQRLLEALLPPGALADATGLTSGAVTALIDRLVDAGLVERRTDPADRRRVIVRVRPKAIEPIKAVYTDMQQRMFALWSKYSSKDLGVIAAFLEQSTALQVECVRHVHSATRPKRRSRRARPRSS